jgi:hypothetical protein
VKFNEKKNQAYEYGQEIVSVSTSSTPDDSTVTSEDAIAQQMRLRASIKNLFADKKSEDEHLIYKLHNVNFSSVLQAMKFDESQLRKPQENKDNVGFRSPRFGPTQLTLQTYQELSEDCFERPLAAGTVAGFLSSVECGRLITASQQLGLRTITTTFHPSYRSDRRVIFWDPGLAAALWSRVKFLLPKRLSDRWSTDWDVLGFGSRMSISEYAEGARYAPHQDNEYVESSTTESLLSVIICLQPAGRGGAINFVDPTQVHKVKLSLPMECGQLLVFPHYLWHEAARVTHGTRFEMRLEVLCREIGSEKDDCDEENESATDEEALEGEKDARSDSEGVDDSELPALEESLPEGQEIQVHDADLEATEEEASSEDHESGKESADETFSAA